MENRNIPNGNNYFDEFRNLIKKLKKNESIEISVLEKFCQDIEYISDLTFQDIITYMLYCFEVIELTQKWKLKKLINYNLFLDNMEDIYNEIFCASKSRFNNKVIAAASFGNVIEKTINYGIEKYIDKILEIYLICIGTKRDYLKDDDLVLLRGNLYCQIYNTIKDNIAINPLYKDYLFKIDAVFDSKKYIKNAKTFYKDILNKNNLTYLELNNFLLFNTYNNYDLKIKEIKKIFTLLFRNFSDKYFDKKIHIYLIKNFVINISNEKELNINLEFIFETKKEEKNTIFLNYNLVDYNFYNNIELLKKLFYYLNNLAPYLNMTPYMELLKAKDDLIANKNEPNTAILNYQTILDYNYLLEFNNFLGIDKIDSFYTYLIKLIKKVSMDKKTDDTFIDRPLTNNEIFRKLYKNNEIRELLKNHHILKLEYDSNGNYKNMAQLVKEKIELSEKVNDKNIDKKIATYTMLITYRDTDIYSLLNDYYSLLIIDSTDSNLIKEKNQILKEKLPNLISQKLLLCGSLKEDMVDEIYKEYINPCIKKISQNRVNKKKFSSTKDFLNYEKSNADNYFGICKLQDILKNMNN
ncbi:MAG: hypothetical protein HFI86_00810 [Bacilli bacterium]|nr:hypothetical protein [Bacilli bacterium]